jgi:hypothetical protein
VSRPDSVDAVASSSPTQSAWANSVADAVNEIADDLYGASQLELPWANITGAPATFAPTLGPVVAAITYGIAPANGVSAAGAHADHLHGTPALPTAAQIGAPAAFDSPAAASGGKRIFVGTATPSGTIAEGDIWIKG